VTTSPPDVRAGPGIAAAPTGAEPPTVGKRRWRGPRLVRWISPIVVLGVWQLLSGAGLVDNRKLPPLNVVWAAAAEVAHNGQLGDGLLVSLRRMFLGFLLGALAGALLALLTSRSRLVDHSIDPLVQMVRNVPLFGAIPLFILWFGIGETPKILLIAIAGGLPIYLNVYAGLREVDPRLVEAATVLGCSRWQRLWHVVGPAAAPLALVGVRLGLASSWLALVVAETVNADSGIGFMINNARDFLRTDIVIVGLLVYSFVGLVMDSVVRAVQRYLLRWRVS
jgi:sulfonate transport system permease protein